MSDKVKPPPEVRYRLEERDGVLVPVDDSEPGAWEAVLAAAEEDEEDELQARLERVETLDTVWRERVAMMLPNPIYDDSAAQINVCLEELHRALSTPTSEERE